MNLKRIIKHGLATRGQVKCAFPKSTLQQIEQAIQTSELTHNGEIRFVVEAALEGLPLFNDQSARERAIDVFSTLRVWDTEHNNGLLIYVLLADRAVEIVADRGIAARVGAPEWETVCRQMEAAFKASHFEGGVIQGVQAVTQHLAAHFPANAASDDHGNELPDRPVLL